MDLFSEIEDIRYNIWITEQNHRKMMKKLEDSHQETIKKLQALLKKKKRKMKEMKG